MGVRRDHAGPPSRPEPEPGGLQAEALSHLDSLFSTALRLTRNRTDAEDLVQDTFLKAVRFADRFERGTNLRAWLFTILHNTFRNARRGAGRDPVDVDSEVVDQAPLAASPDSAPDASLWRDALDDDVKHALDALPPAFREAVWLRDVEDLSYAEIAGVVGVPLGTVMSRIARGRKLLHARLVAARQGTAAGETPRHAIAGTAAKAGRPD